MEQGRRYLLVLQADLQHQPGYLNRVKVQDRVFRRQSYCVTPATLLNCHCCLLLQRGHWVVPDGDACSWVACDGPEQRTAGLIDGCRQAMRSCGVEQDGV